MGDYENIQYDVECEYHYLGQKYPAYEFDYQELCVDQDGNFFDVIGVILPNGEKIAERFFLPSLSNIKKRNQPRFTTA